MANTNCCKQQISLSCFSNDFNSNHHLLVFLFLFHKWSFHKLIKEEKLKLSVNYSCVSFGNGAGWFSKMWRAPFNFIEVGRVVDIIRYRDCVLFKMLERHYFKGVASTLKPSRLYKELCIHTKNWNFYISDFHYFNLAFLFRSGFDRIVT